jgi:phenylalanyl-tRNA synthetase beta chain
MIAAQGFTEVSNYSFVSEEEVKRFGLRVEDHVRVLNPIAAGQELMRTSLLPGVWRNITENARHFESFRLFEIGREIHKRPEGLPDERPHLVAAIFAKDDGRAGLFELRRTAECLAAGLHVRPAEPQSWEHPARCAELWWNGRQIGRLSELHPSLVDGGRAAVVDIDLTLLRELAPAQASYTPVRRFPTSAFDLSVICSVRDFASTLALAIQNDAHGLVNSVEYIREYQGEPLEKGKKSVTFRIVVGAADHTLTSAEITDSRNQIIMLLTLHDYELRV